ncbi:MAG TPA: hypothetical protein VGD42_05750 [Lysobacter sp.]
MAAVACVALLLIAGVRQAATRRSPPLDRPTPAVPATPDEQTAILAAVLPRYLTDEVSPRRQQDGAGSGRRLVMVAQTFQLCALAMRDQPCASIREEQFRRPGKRPSRQERDLLRARETSESVMRLVLAGKVAPDLGLPLIEANREVASVAPDSLPRFVMLMAEDDLRSLLDHDGGLRDWMRFYANLPNAAGYVKASQAVVARDGSRALVLISHSCGGLCGSGQLHVLERGLFSWHIRQTLELWVS